MAPGIFFKHQKRTRNYQYHDGCYGAQLPVKQWSLIKEDGRTWHAFPWSSCTLHCLHDCKQKSFFCSPEHLSDASLSILEHALLFTHPLGKVTIMEMGLIMSNISLSQGKKNSQEEKKKNHLRLRCVLMLVL